MPTGGFRTRVTAADLAERKLYMNQFQESTDLLWKNFNTNWGWLAPFLLGVGAAIAAAFAFAWAAVIAIFMMIVAVLMPIWVKLAAYIALFIVIMIVMGVSYGGFNFWGRGGAKGQAAPTSQETAGPDDDESRWFKFDYRINQLFAQANPYSKETATVLRAVESKGRCDGINKVEVPGGKCLSTALPPPAEFASKDGTVYVPYKFSNDKQTFVPNCEGAYIKKNGANVLINVLKSTGDAADKMSCIFK